MSNETRQIAFYGKGGIGKSTVATNVAVAAADLGRKVMMVGCSPKVDSTAFLLGGEPADINILDHSRAAGASEKTILDAVMKGHKGILCVEAGGPEPAEGCAGRGIALALDLMKKFKVFQRFGVDLVIYDVIADVVCGGFAQPMRQGYAKEVYLVSSGELMSLYSSNNICLAVSILAKAGAAAAVGGIVNNMRGVENEEVVVAEFASRVGVPVKANIPRDGIVQQAESRSGSVVEVFPESAQAQVYRNLAKSILENGQTHVPTPMELQDIVQLLRSHQALD